MSEELLQRDLIDNPEKTGKWDFYNIGTTTVKTLKEYGIIRNVDYGNVNNKKVDAIIIQRKNVIAVIEYKKPSEFKTRSQQDKAVKQEIEVAKKLGSKIIIATDTKDTVWVNALTGKRIKDENGKEIKTDFDPKAEKLAELIEKINYSINERNNNLKPKQLVNPTDLAKSIWQDIWSVSGATPENCLYTFVELFIFKYLSDLGVLGEGINFDHLIERYSYKLENVEEKALEYYAGTIRPEIKRLFPENLEDKTTIINGTIFVSKDQKAVKGYSTVFKKVIYRFKNYGKLEHIDYDFKSRLFESFLKESISKKNWGQFFTPLKVVRAIVEMAKDDIKDGIKICDPACGVGKFLLEPIVTRLGYLYEITKKGIKPKVTIHGFDKGFDKDEQKTIILAKANMLIYFSDLIKDNPGHTKDFAKLFNESFTLKTNSILGTLSEPVEEEYDLILTNPPYVTSGSSNLKEEIRKNGDLIDYYKVNAMGVEGLFVEWIIKALKPNGKAYVVIPDGILNRQNDKNLRKFILDECFLDGIISLPINTFFTTNKKTYIFCITKKVGKTEVQKEPVFTYLVSEIGESRDVYRFDIDQNDLQEAVTLYTFFKSNKNNFTKINSDKRCKVQPFDNFLNNIETNWVIDKWWTEEEKVELGIIEKNEKVTLFEFSSIIEDVANSIQELQEEIKELVEKKKLKIKFQNFGLNKLFDIERGVSKYTKKYGNSNKGDYPVYSASNKAPLTYINSFDYDGEYLTWATNGFAGYIKVVSDKFSINADRGLLKPKKGNINIKYIKHKLEPVLRKIAKGRKGERGDDEFTKVYPSMIECIKIPIPINEQGEFDILAQKEMVKKVVFIEEIKKKVEDDKKRINDLNVSVESNQYSSKFKEVLIGDIFELSPIKGLTARYIQSNRGDIPVYGGKKEENPIGFVKNDLKEVKYFENCLAWNREGSVGYVFWHKHKFSTNDHHRPMTVKTEYKSCIDLAYMKHTIQDALLKQGFRWSKTASKIKVAKTMIKIPINRNGKFDLQAQKQIANKYQKIEEIKLAINKELDKISETEIEFE